MSQTGDPTDAATSLWTFAVSVYERPGTSEAAIALQDAYGADVVLILFCLWLPAGRFAQVAPQALAIARQWQASVVTPLRAGRRALKAMAATDPQVAHLREQVKVAELEAERLQFRALATLTSVGPQVSTSMPLRAAASQNLDAYFSTAQIQLDPLGKTLVLRILDAAFET